MAFLLLFVFSVTLLFLAGGGTGSARTAESVVSPLLSASATVFFFTGAFLLGIIRNINLLYLIVGLIKDGYKCCIMETCNI